MIRFTAGLFVLALVFLLTAYCVPEVESAPAPPDLSQDQPMISDAQWEADTQAIEQGSDFVMWLAQGHGFNDTYAGYHCILSKPFGNAEVGDRVCSKAHFYQSGDGIRIAVSSPEVNQDLFVRFRFNRNTSSIGWKYTVKMRFRDQGMQSYTLGTEDDRGRVEIPAGDKLLYGFIIARNAEGVTDHAGLLRAMFWLSK